MERHTLDFCSPEALRREPATEAMDMFALGRVMQWMASTSEAWDAWSCLNKVYKRIMLLKENAITITEADIPHTATRQLVMSLLKKNVRRRRRFVWGTVRVHPCMVVCVCADMLPK